MTRAALLAAALVLSAVAPACAQEAAKPEQLEISTPDGMRLAGTYYPPQGRPAKGAPSVVALHMYRNKRQSYAPIAAAITAKLCLQCVFAAYFHHNLSATQSLDVVLLLIGLSSQLLQDSVDIRKRMSFLQFVHRDCLRCSRLATPCLSVKLFQRISVEGLEAD